MDRRRAGHASTARLRSSAIAPRRATGSWWTASRSQLQSAGASRGFSCITSRSASWSRAATRRAGARCSSAARRAAWVAVGRLDINSSGLLLFTDSGELAQPPDASALRARARVRRAGAGGTAARGEDSSCWPASSSTAGRRASKASRRTGEGEGSNRWYRVVLKEGRNREVRRLFEALGHPVSRLMRVRYGPVELPADLAPGRWRELRNPVILQKL